MQNKKIRNLILTMGILMPKNMFCMDQVVFRETIRDYSGREIVLTGIVEDPDKSSRMGVVQQHISTFENLGKKDLVDRYTAREELFTLREKMLKGQGSLDVRRLSMPAMLRRSYAESLCSVMGKEDHFWGIHVQRFSEKEFEQEIENISEEEMQRYQKVVEEYEGKCSGARIVPVTPFAGNLFLGCSDLIFNFIKRRNVPDTSV